MSLPRFSTALKYLVQNPGNVERCRGLTSLTVKKTTHFKCSGSQGRQHEYTREKGVGPTGVLLSGVLGWFGLSKIEPTEEENLEMTVKMAILAIQVI